MRFRAIALSLATALGAACGEPAREPGMLAGLPPPDTEARALHCYLVMTLTLDQMAEFESAGTREARRQSEEFHLARTRHAEGLEAELLDQLRRDPWPSLYVMLSDFDTDGDGELSSAAEVAEFNRHIAACL